MRNSECGIQPMRSGGLTPQSAMEWPPRLVSRQRLLGFSEALICLSYSGSAFVLRAMARLIGFAQIRIGLPSRSSKRSEERRLVVPRGNAPRSSGYQPGALHLSYGTISNCGFEPNRLTRRNTILNCVAGLIQSHDLVCSSCERAIGFHNARWVS